MKKYLIDIISTVAWVFCLTGCLEQKGPDGLFSPAALEVTEVKAFDWSGGIDPLDAIARQVRIELKTSQSVDGSDQPAMLLSGSADQRLLEDLEKAPLRAENTERLIRCRIEYRQNSVILVPERPLNAGATYTVALAGWTRSTNNLRLNSDGAPFFEELTVSKAADSGAQVTDCWPADGTAGVAPNLDFAAIRFDGEFRGVEQGIWLQDSAGFAVPASVSPLPCERIGWSGGQCAVIAPNAQLTPDAGYQIAVGSAVRDARSAPVGPWSAEFRTAAVQDREPPGRLELPCAVDEQAVEVGCALVDDQSIELRVRVDEPARIRLSAEQKSVLAVAPRGEARLSIGGLSADSPVQLELLAADSAGNQTIRRLKLRTYPELAKLSITEVRADPRGPEPEQEYVEVLNWGDTPVDLKGFSLSDDPNAPGQRIEESAVVQPGARALLVPDGFNCDEPKDDAPPAGATLVRVGAELAGSGLSNSGEPLFLRDASGRRLSAAPALPRPRSGVCIVRVVENMRDGSEGSFDYDRDGRCTPGE